MKKVHPIKEVCIGCHLCEIACVTAHSQSGDIVIAWREERRQGLIESCRHVVHKGPVCVALSCRHCEEPACVATCISGALTKDPVSGRTEYDASKCVGCWSCLMACPFGAIQRHPTRKCIVKCDLCAGRETPACVEACPNMALVFEDRSKKKD
ncbi:4Fe-4S dicluster domain-containing protein [Desulfovibrio inopinatus]|uniref:4Fe-4S dicluster domain-containing protein n=1 Tax=Desulfovibrio inopinatus TaxID=102109 RepID=UPI00041ADEA3|nr:4Fe-4S dicluster domain-containing protein [Desulfovibrio inopinatus]